MVSLLSACAIETVLALAVTAINNPFDATFAPAWWAAFRSAFPAGLAISLFMRFYMKPKMDLASAKHKQGAAPAAR